MQCEKMDDYATKKSCGFLELSLGIRLSNQQCSLMKTLLKNAIRKDMNIIRWLMNQNSGCSKFDKLAKMMISWLCPLMSNAANRFKEPVHIINNSFLLLHF